LPLYLVPGAVMWYCLLKSGVHATLAGVLLAFAIPFCDGDEACPSNKLLHFLHKPVAFIIMPLFALANTGIVLDAGWLGSLATANSVGIFGGLLLGKTLGVAIFTFIAVKVGVSILPDDLTWSHVLGAGLLGGIGFTMSIFITLLAFTDPGIVQGAKISVLLSSVVAGTAGFLLLRRTVASR
jgi:NhaA family Na+:H+ antiporter